MNVTSIIRTLISMLCSAKKKGRPENDEEFMHRA